MIDRWKRGRVNRGDGGWRRWWKGQQRGCRSWRAAVREHREMKRGSKRGGERG